MTTTDMDDPNVRQRVWKCWGCGKTVLLTEPEWDRSHDHYNHQGYFCGEFNGVIDGRQAKLSARLGASMAGGMNALGYREWQAWGLSEFGSPFAYHTKDSTYRAYLQRSPSND